MKKIFLTFLIITGAMFVIATPAFASGGVDELRECIKEASQVADADLALAIDECHAAPEPIVPPIFEVVWAAIAFSVVLFVLGKFAFPKIRKGLEDRQTGITKDLEDAENAKNEAQDLSKQNKSELNKAKQEAQKIIDAAKTKASVKKNEIIKAGEEEATNLKAKAEADANRIVAQAVNDANSQIAEISLEVAEKVIGSSINKDANDELVKQFVQQVSESKIKG